MFSGNTKMEILIQIFCCFLITTEGATVIKDCSSGTVEVVKDSPDFSLTCEGYTGTAVWTYQAPSSAVQRIGSCGSACQLDDPSLSPYFSLTVISATSSRLDFTSDATASSFSDYAYTCGSTSCTIKLVEPTTTQPTTTTTVQPVTSLSTPALSTSRTSTVQPVNISTPALSTSKTSTASSTVTGTTHTMASSTTAVSTNSDGSTTGNTQSTEKTTETPQRLITIYVGAGFAGLVLIVLIAIVIVLWYRRHRRQRANRKIQTENISPSSKGKPSPNDTVHHQQETHM